MSDGGKMIKQIIEQIKSTLSDQAVDYEKHIKDFGQVHANNERMKGKTFNFREHIKGLIYAQLSNQRSWGPIARNLETINKIFCEYNPEVLKIQDPNHLEAQIVSIKCGNRKIASQLAKLRSNIETFEKITLEYGNIDAFVTSDVPEKIAKELGSGKKYKLKEIGFTLALEYLRNIGINAIKPDLHICRLIGPERLRFIDKIPTPEEAYHCLMDLEHEIPESAVYLDNLLWIFAAKDYGNICTANPKCNYCSVELCVMHPSGKRK